MERSPDSDLDIHAHRRSLALQQIDMLTRIAEIGMRLVEAEGAKAIAQAEQPEAERPGQPGAGAPRAEAPAARDHGLVFARHAQTVQRALALRGRVADSLCAGDKADRRARRGRQRNHVTEALFALIWGAATGSTQRDLEEAEYRITEMRDLVDDLYGDEEDRVEDRPVGSVIAGLACGLRLSEQWHRRATDWSDGPYPPPPAGVTPAAARKRRRARVRELMQRTIDAYAPERIPVLRAGLEARLKEPDVEALIDAEPPMRAAQRLCASLGIDFDEYKEPKQPDTG